MKKLTIIAVIALLVPMLVSAQDDKPLSIAVINMAKVAAETDIGKASQDRVTQFVQAKDAELQQEFNKLRSDAAELESQRTILSADAFAQKENDLQKRQLELEQKRRDIQRQFNSMRQEELANFLKVASPIIEALGKEREYSMIIDISPSSTNQLIYTDASIEITDEVVRRVNAASQSGN
jgi:Skp family chaperone for outer membrane proteins